jgi:hypothetical protein
LNHPAWDTQTSTTFLSQHIDRFVVLAIVAPSMAAPSGDPFVFLFFSFSFRLAAGVRRWICIAPLRESWAALLKLVVCCC